MKTFYDFPYFLMPDFDGWFPVTTKQTLLGIYMFKVVNKTWSMSKAET